MIPFESIFILPVALAILNRVRGNFKFGAVITALFLGAFFYLLTMNPLAGVGVAVAYFVGETFGWGKWLEAFTYFEKTQEEYNISSTAKRDTGHDNGIHFIANKIFPEKENFKKYTLTALTIRGIYWWAPIFAALVFFFVITPIPAVIGTLMMGLAFPLSFFLTWKFKQNGEFWSYGEYVYGFLQGLILVVTLLMI